MKQEKGLVHDGSSSKEGRRDELEKLFAMMTASRHCVAFTGAGVSTFSGIQDFRGKHGLYRTTNANKIFDISVFRQDPSYYYSMTADFIYGLDEKKPSIVHLVLAELERRDIVRAVITQNIDLLHQKAGSRHVIEIHGSPDPHHCTRCGEAMSFADAAAIVRGGGIPHCPRCGAVMKPDITFFGESLPQRAIMEAMAEAESADLMLVLGSSLTVYPAASLPEWTLDSGGAIVIVNDMPTHLDGRARLRFTELGPVFEYLAERLGMQRDGSGALQK